MVDKESYDDTARKYRVSCAVVYFLIKKVKKNPKYLEELRTIIDEK